MSRLISFSLSLLFCLVLAAASQAVTSLTLTNCDADGCNGADLTLAVEQQGTDWKVTYTFDTTGYDDVKSSLVQVGFKVVQGWSTAELLSAPNGVGNWSDVMEAPVNSNGSPCGSGGNATDKVCIFAKNNLLNVTTNGNYVFEFKLTGGSLMPTSDWHFGGQWGDSLISRGSIISVDAAAVPEPSAALLFAIGAVTVGRSLRRRA
jgi:hypothetical protein